MVKGKVVDMFPFLALLCFLLALFGVKLTIDLVILGFVFVALALLFGNWPVGYISDRMRQPTTRA